MGERGEADVGLLRYVPQPATLAARVRAALVVVVPSGALATRVAVVMATVAVTPWVAVAVVRSSMVAA